MDRLAVNGVIELYSQGVIDLIQLQSYMLAIAWGMDYQLQAAGDFLALPRR